MSSWFSPRFPCVLSVSAVRGFPIVRNLIGPDAVIVNEGLLSHLKMRRIPTVLFLAFALAPALTPAPQALQPQPSDNVIRITVNLVQVDAVVMDSEDKPVTDLRKEDFVVLQDGKSQVITNFSFISTKEGAVRSTPVKPAPVVNGEKAKGAKAPPPPPPIATRPKQIRRTVALVVDDLGLSFES